MQGTRASLSLVAKYGFGRFVTEKSGGETTPPPGVAVRKFQSGYLVLNIRPKDGTVSGVESYAVEVEPRVLRSLRRINQADQRRILDRIDGLAAEPRPPGCEKLQGAEGFRVIQGDYRIIYTIDDSKRVVTVTKVGHRKDVYR